MGGRLSWVRTLFVLPAVLVPLMLVIVVAAFRRVGEAAAGLRRELQASAALEPEVSALRQQAVQLRQRSRRGRSQVNRASN